MSQSGTQTEAQVHPQNQSNSSGPGAEYRARLDSIVRDEIALVQSDRFYIGLKIAIFAVGALLGAWLMKYAPAYLSWLFLVLLVFALSFVLHERVLRRLRLARQRKSFYQRGLDRLEGRWPGTGRQGAQFLDAAHPYARDLDLFGKGGLFELICTARTSAGEQKLAGWLLAPASIQEIHKRQQAVRELAPCIDFQEHMALAGEDVQTGDAHTPEALTTWAETSHQLTAAPTIIRLLYIALAAAWALALLLWMLSHLNALPIWHWGAIALGISALNLILSAIARKQIVAAAEAVEAAGKELPLLAAVFSAIEQESFSSPKLTELQNKLRAAGTPPSRAVAKLNGYRENLMSAHNVLVKAVDPFVFWTRQWVWSAESWRASYGTSVRSWLAAAAEVEALLSLAVYTREHPGYIFPELAVLPPDSAPYLEAEDLAHPLVPGHAIGNNVRLGHVPGEVPSANLQLIIISGPNMAGKSTFTRSVGVNAVLAQAGAPVRARNMTLSELQVAASICILDSLQGGLSRFYAEITRLKQIYDLTTSELPVLFLMDELLSGTNSHDRRVGTESIVRGLVHRRAIGIVTTHDLALTDIVATLDGRAANFHFGDTFANGKLSFDYKLLPGIAESTNALELMRSIGLTGE
jgi:MutS domain V